MATPSWYVTTFCNGAHMKRSGKPVRHACFVLPPSALAMEQAGNVESAVDEIRAWQPLQPHAGVGWLNMTGRRRKNYTNCDSAFLYEAARSLYHIVTSCVYSEESRKVLFECISSHQRAAREAWEHEQCAAPTLAPIRAREP